MRRIFVTGLAALVPVVVTGYVLTSLFLFADGMLGKFINARLQNYIGFTIPGLGLIITVFIVFFAGTLVHISRMRLARFMERMFLSRRLTPQESINGLRDWDRLAQIMMKALASPRIAIIIFW